MQDDVVSASDAAVRLGVHPETVKRLCRQGALPASKFGRSWLIRRTDLERFAESYRGAPGRPRKAASRGRGREVAR